MSVRPLSNLPLRQAFRQSSLCTRRIHNVSRRPELLLPRQVGSPPKPLRQRRQNATFARGARELFSKNPFSVTLAAVVIFIGASGIIYANYVYQNYIINSFHQYPEPVAKKLRKALYYTNMDLNPQEALKFYKQGLEVANQEGMDPFSDEIIGVKIQVAKLMEDIQQLHKAIEVLERVRSDNLAWLQQFGGLDKNKQKRTRVLAKTVAISVKLGELYGQPAIYDRDMAQERLVWAVETVLQEKQRRQTQKVSEEEEGKWMTDEEVGAALESLAHSYEAQDLHYLATPLFLQALNLYPTQDCHSVILMNNLASSLAQQSPVAARDVQAYATSRNIDARAAGPIATRESMIEMAKAWVQKALDVAANIKPPVRNEECDIGCAVAAHHLGSFAEMNKDFPLARRKYEEAVSLSRAVGFEEGMAQSSARLQQLAMQAD